MEQLDEFGIPLIESDAIKEMEQFFEKRTQEHIDRVRNNLLALEGYAGFESDELMQRASEHDSTKFEEPEKTPYVWLTWQKKCKKEGVPFEYPEGMKKRVDEATKHHILVASHHPEFHAKEDLKTFSRDSAEAHEEEIVEVGRMPKSDIVEMVCDWTALAQELGQNGGSAKDWADKNISKRWKFHSDDVDFIYQTIEELDKRLRGSDESMNESVDSFGIPLGEGLSKIVYHWTDFPQVLSILESDEFHLATSVGTRADDVLNPKGYPYYLSVARNVSGHYWKFSCLVLDGEKLGSRYKAGPVSYWGPEFHKADPKMHELEDRVWSNERVIPNATSYIKEIHMLWGENVSWREGQRQVVLKAKLLKIPIYLYSETKHLKTLNKNRAIDTSGWGKEQWTAEYEPYRFRSYGREGEWIDPWIELFYKSDEGDLSKEAKEIIYAIGWNKRDKLASIEASIHNDKNKPHIAKLVDVMKKAGAKNADEYVDFLYNKWHGKKESVDEFGIPIQEKEYEPGKYVGNVYLIHFQTKYKHAAHYIGFTFGEVEQRVSTHKAGKGARLLQVLNQNNIEYDVVRTWPDVDRHFERRLKNQKNSWRLCPLCKHRHGKPIVDKKIGEASSVENENVLMSLADEGFDSIMRIVDELTNMENTQ